MTAPQLLVHGKKDMVGADPSETTGHDIGKMVAAIAKGEHVHAHSLKTERW